ncbi:hypothetical protein HMPREF9104_02272 [Lentilactobacillus kisonensis F0435]|uniref:Uncharacterized protein n=1 Tax=Lentilactobacillus kisonensis F0435 TaxID=797516 RepID=H1LI31_9LACO|nr:hypothetical protein HMPREF9104_02272 [Lentilactobacillus kisonensis F0435]
MIIKSQLQDKVVRSLVLSCYFIFCCVTVFKYCHLKINLIKIA